MLIFITDGEIIKIWGLHNITDTFYQICDKYIYIYTCMTIDCRLESKAVWNRVEILLSHMWDTTFVVVSCVYCSSQMTQHVWSRCLRLCACVCGSFSSTTCCPQAWIDRMKPPSPCHNKSLSPSLSLALVVLPVQSKHHSSAHVCTLSAIKIRSPHVHPKRPLCLYSFTKLNHSTNAYHTSSFHHDRKSLLLSL